MRMLLKVPLLFLLLLGGCGPAEVVEWPVQQGQVIDEVTGKGIEGAIVVALWGGMAEYTSSVCFHVESAVTDRKGRFEIPMWRNDTRWRRTEKQHVAITVYKPGYEESDRTYKTQSYKEGVYYQKPFAGSAKERLAYLEKTARATNCRLAGRSERNSYAFYKGLYEESKHIAVTDEDIKISGFIKRSAAYKGIAEEGFMSGEEMEKRLIKFIEENLE